MHRTWVWSLVRELDSMYRLWKIFHAATERSKILHATTITQSSQISKKKKNKKLFLNDTATLWGQGQHFSTQVPITWPNVGHRAGAWHKLPEWQLTRINVTLSFILHCYLIISKNVPEVVKRTLPSPLPFFLQEKCSGYIKPGKYHPLFNSTIISSTLKSTCN